MPDRACGHPGADRGRLLRPTGPTAGPGGSAQPPTGADQPSSIDDGDGWVQCGCGQRHWGRYGAAGLLLADGDGQVVLQHRAPWSHHGGTWGIPGGARNRSETPAQAAIREAGEEAGLGRDVRLHASHVLDHPDWSYTTVLGHVPAGTPVRATDAESVQVRWYPAAQVTGLPLLGAFATAWPLLRRMLGTEAVLVVDAANVVGSRPDGWWKDRAGATNRLAGRLAALARSGIGAAALDLPGHCWWPTVVLVTEGQARQVSDVPGIHVRRAPGSGDDEVVRVTTQAMAGQFGPAAAPRARMHLSVVSADRELRQRVQAAGARVLGPGQLWQMLDEVPA